VWCVAEAKLSEFIWNATRRRLCHGGRDLNEIKACESQDQDVKM